MYAISIYTYGIRNLKLEKSKLFIHLFEIISENFSKSH